MARASALHAEGQGFDSLILHQKTRYDWTKEREYNSLRERIRISKKNKHTNKRL